MIIIAWVKKVFGIRSPSHGGFSYDKMQGGKLTQLWRHLTKYWYCEYCDAWHSQKEQSIHMLIMPSQIRTMNAPQFPARCVCSLGEKALKEGTWRPEVRSSLDEAITACTFAVSNLGRAFSSQPNNTRVTVPREHPLDKLFNDQDRWPWLSTYEPPEGEREDWSPKIWFKCDPKLNATCKKSTCGQSETGNCYLTANPAHSIDGKILWPDIQFWHVLESSPGESAGCKTCPMDPLECKCYARYRVHEIRPCEEYDTYTDFRLG